MTAPPKRVLVLHDSLQFGGHERAFLTWLPTLLESPAVERVTLSFPKTNDALAEALAPFAGPKLQLRPGRFSKQRAEPFLAPFRLAYRGWIRRLIVEEQPQVVLLLQGRIENLAVAMLALPPGPEVVSYLPMAHSGREMGRPPLAAWLTDGLKRIYYGRPDRFAVPSAAVAGQLRRAGARGEIRLVRNVPGPSNGGRSGPPEAASSARRSALFLGRIEVRQKGLDHLLRSIALAREELKDWEFRFVGEGPDLPWLRSALAVLPDIVSRTESWTEAPREALAAADLVLMPSRFEGVPLVLLEALADRVPVLASPIDVFEEHLPPANLFQFGRSGLAEAMEAATDPAGQEAYRAHAASLDPTLDAQRSRQAFLLAVLGGPPPEPSLQGGGS